MVKLGKWSWPRSKAGGIAMVAVLLGSGLAATIGAGYTVARPLLTDGSEFLARGRTVVHVNGESGKTDAELARELASGKEGLTTVRLPDGRLAVVNTDTGDVSIYDASTMEQVGEDTKRPGSPGMLETLPTRSHAYLVDKKRGVIEEIDDDGNAGKPVRISGGIRDAVPSGDAIWVVTGSGSVAEVANGKVRRVIPLGGTLRITVADGHPVVVAKNGDAYVVDGAEPRLVGRVNLSPDSVLGSWRGSGRYIIGVDKRANRVVALDPRTADQFSVDLPIPQDAVPDLQAPVQLGDRVYVPDYSGPVLWKAELFTKQAEPLKVPGKRGPIEVKVSSEQVWANSQYDQRALLVDNTGQERLIDKGPGNGVEDSERKPNRDKPSQDKPPVTSTPSPAPSTGPRPGESSGPPPAKQAVVPAFPRGTKYRQACAELRRVELGCESVAAGDARGLGPDEVIDTAPPAGSQLPVGTMVLVRYVGPVRVPNVLDLNHADACDIIKAANLECQAEAETELAETAEKLLKVSQQEPAEGQEINKGDTVRIRYPDTVSLPSFVGRQQSAVCGELHTSYHMNCDPISGAGPANLCRTSGTVYQQNPAADTATQAGSTIALSFCAGGAVIVPDYRGRDFSAACKDASEVDGLRCAQPISGTCGPLNVVYEQNPPPGAQHDPQAEIQLTHHVECRPVPDVLNRDPDVAKATLDGAGFIGQHQYELAPNYRVVNRQQYAPGTQLPVNTPVDIHWSPREPVELSVDLHGTFVVLRQGPGQRSVGRAYTEEFPNLWVIRELSCADTSKCNALSRFYSRIEGHDGWSISNGAVAWLMTPVSPTDCAEGTQELYRVWNGPENTREYGIEWSTGGWAGNELIGCVWR